jgi:hypothetical protein
MNRLRRGNRAAEADDAGARSDGNDREETEDETMTIICPEGVGPGDALEVTTPAGQQVAVPVPDGIQPGEEFEISVSCGPALRLTPVEDEVSPGRAGRELLSSLNASGVAVAAARASLSGASASSSGGKLPEVRPALRAVRADACTHTWTRSRITLSSHKPMTLRRHAAASSASTRCC